MVLSIFIVCWFLELTDIFGIENGGKGINKIAIKRFPYAKADILNSSDTNHDGKKKAHKLIRCVKLIEFILLL